MEKGIQIQYLGLQVKETTMKIGGYDKSIANEIESELEIKTGFTDDKADRFVIIFNLKLFNKERDFYLNIEAHNHFVLNQDITEEFKKSTFINVNAPAIAFPYIRAYISNITLNSGYDSIILPSYNFVKIYKEKIKKEE
jgi:preprotein translocase subunit SecB